MRVAPTLVLVLALFSSTAEAQREQDAELWLRAGVRVRVHRRVGFDIHQYVRLADRFRDPERVMSQFGVHLRAARALRISAAYRYIRALDNNPDSRHRLQLDARLRGDLGPLRWSHRVRYQVRLRDGRRARHHVRNRASLALPNDSRVTPFISTELFVELGGADPLAVDAWRGSAGVTVGRRGHDVDVYYRIEVELGRGASAIRHILALAYRFSAKVYD